MKDSSIDENFFWVTFYLILKLITVYMAEDSKLAMSYLCQTGVSATLFYV